MSQGSRKKESHVNQHRMHTIAYSPAQHMTLDYFPNYFSSNKSNAAFDLQQSAQQARRRRSSQLTLACLDCYIMKDLAVAATAAALGGAGVLFKRLNRSRKPGQVCAVTDVVLVLAVHAALSVDNAATRFLSHPSNTRSCSCEIHSTAG